MNNLLLFDVGTGILIIIIIAIPMVFQKIKPNYFYGFRTKKTLSDEKIWYPANKYSGKTLIYAGVVMTIVSFVLYLLTTIPQYANIFNKTIIIILTIIILSVPLIVSIIASFIYLKKL